MATRTITLNILINGTGTEIPNLLTTDPYELYLIQGTAIAIGNYAIVPTGTPSLGLTYKFKYKASLDITTNSKTFSLFGTSITQEQLNKNWSAECYYNGTSWDIILDMDFSEAGIISSTNLQSNIINSTALANGSVTTPKLANLAVTDAKLASDAVTTSKILDANVTTAKIADDAITTVKVLDANITTPKINDLAVTTNKINTGAVTNTKVASNAIDTANIITNAVTNSKLALGTPSSVKIVDAAGNVQDLALGINELPIGNGTTITKLNLSLLNNQLLIFNYTLTPTDWTIIGITGLTILPSPPIGKYYKIINAQGSITNATTPFSGADLYLSYFAANITYGKFDGLLDSTIDKIVEIDRVPSSSVGGTNTQILPNALILNTAGNTPTVGTGTIKITILYTLETY